MEGSISIIQWAPWLIGSSGLVGIALILFKIGKAVGAINGRFDVMDQRFDSVDRRFNSIDQRFNSIERQISEIKSDVRSVNDRLTRLEVRFEERTLRVIHVDKTGTEEKK